MKKIKVCDIDGYYYVEDNYLCYCCDDLDDDIDVSDLSDLTIYQYNDLSDQLNNHYPDYDINKLNGRFI
tara:strand:+ start:468 stop:674 length:207 start_codon:yes stop_codon:yes gene_type:complete